MRRISDSGIPVRIAQVHRIVKAVAIPIRAHTRLCRIEPVGLDEHAEAGVIVAGVEVLQAGVGVEAFDVTVLEKL
jgi:hypothetical protein